MKHILNNISQDEKRRILEQHTGGKQLFIENFNKLVNNKLGTVNTLINEGVTVGQNYDKNYFMGKKQGTINFDDYGFPTTVDGVNVMNYDTEFKPFFTVKNIGGRGFQGGDYKWTYSEKVGTGAMGPGQEKPGISITNDQNQEVGTLIF
jgi:hypothetical protein